MDEQRYVIVDIHPDDACSEDKNTFLGRLVEIRHVNQSKAHVDFISCDVLFIPVIQNSDGSTTKRMYFYAVQLQTEEDNTEENGRLVKP